MKKKSLRGFGFSLFWILGFVLWTIAVKYIDVSAIGPNESAVGFSTVNGFFHRLTGVNMSLYTITDWLGLVPFFIAFSFGIIGLTQLIKRKSILKVDLDILILGGFYIVVIAVYILFEIIPVNYRPVLIEEILEVSYPSSTTMLTMCVMPSAIIQFKLRIKNIFIKNVFMFSSAVFTAFMVIARLISGVHWLTDIIGGGILSVGLVMMYRFLILRKSKHIAKMFN